MDESISSEYLSWLKKFLGDTRYRKLIKIMLKKEYLFFIEHDVNRYSDVMAFRNKYMNSGHSSDERCLGMPCSFLEVIISLAEIIESIMYDPYFGDRTVLWFWMIVYNSGLSLYTDEFINTHKDAIYDIEICMDNIINRNYYKNGCSGFFPLKKPPDGIDQRNVELWYQLNYFIENNEEFMTSFKWPL